MHKAFVSMTVLIGLGAGCARQQPGPAPAGPVQLAATQPAVVVPAGPVSDAQLTDLVKRDPVAALRVVRDRCAALKQYKLVFYRQERLGLLGQMGKTEKVNATFRAEPFSVKFEWPDEDMQLYESVYVRGQNQDKLILRERHGYFPFPAQVRVVDVMFPGKVGMAKNPITDFGLLRVVERSLIPFDDPAVRPLMTVTYEGTTTITPTGQTAHYIKITRPKMKGYAYTRQDMYIDTTTLLPAGTDLFLPDGRLDASYRYGHIDTNLQLTDADFRLSKDHPEVK